MNRKLALAAIAAVAILGLASQTNAATLLTPGTTQVEYTFGEPGVTWAQNFQTDASSNGRTMAGGGGPDNWLGGAIAPGSANSWMIADGKCAYIMNNTAGMASDFQVSIYLSASANWPSVGATGAGAAIFHVGDLVLQADGNSGNGSMTYYASVGATQLGSFTAGEWQNTGLMVQKVGSTFSYWVTTNTGATWTQYGSDVSAPTANVNWSGTHLFVRPGGGYNYTGYADDFKVVAAIPEPSTWMLVGFGLLGTIAMGRRNRRAA